MKIEVSPAVFLTFSLSVAADGFSLEKRAFTLAFFTFLAESS